MDWAFAIERNRIALGRVVAAIVALIGGREGDGAISRGLRSAALALLRPAESAARRLIVIAARGLDAGRDGSRLAAPRPPFPAALGGKRRSGPHAAFALFDRPLRFARMVRVVPRVIPRIRSFWCPPSAQPVSPPLVSTPGVRPDPAALVDAARLRLRLAALEAALADLPRQARRLARWRARRGLAGRSAVGARSPLRIGRPPGQRRGLRGRREVDDLLGDCHALALDALRADTS